MENIFKSREVSVVIGKPYNLVIESTTGQTIREGMTAVLSAKVFNIDTQAYEPASGFTFKWQRNEKPTEFNEKTGDTISITYADVVGGNATFTCVASSADWNGTAYIMMSENAPGWSTARLILYKESEAIPDVYDGSNIEYTFADGSYNPTNPTLGFGTWKKDKPNTELPVYAIYNNAQSQTETAIAEASNWTTPEKISADSAKGLKIISPTAVFDTSSRGYVTKDIELRFQCKATNSDKPISWSVLPIDKYIDYTSEGLGASGNNNEFFTIKILRKYNGDRIDVSARIDSDNLIDVASLTKNAPIRKHVNLGILTSKPNNDNAANDPFVIPNEGPIDNFDHFTLMENKGDVDKNGNVIYTQSVMYFKKDGVTEYSGYWVLIDELEKDPDYIALGDPNLKFDMAQAGRQAALQHPNSKYSGAYMNLYIENASVNYIAAEKMDARDIELISDKSTGRLGQIRTAGYNRGDIGNLDDPNDKGTGKPGIYIGADENGDGYIETQRLLARNGLFVDADVRGILKSQALETKDKIDCSGSIDDVDVTTKHKSYLNGNDDSTKVNSYNAVCMRGYEYYYTPKNKDTYALAMVNIKTGATRKWTNIELGIEQDSSVFAISYQYNTFYLSIFHSVGWPVNNDYIMYGDSIDSLKRCNLKQDTSGPSNVQHEWFNQSCADGVEIHYIVDRHDKTGISENSIILIVKFRSFIFDRNDREGAVCTLELSNIPNFATVLSIRRNSEIDASKSPLFFKDSGYYGKVYSAPRTGGSKMHVWGTMYDAYNNWLYHEYSYYPVFVENHIDNSFDSDISLAGYGKIIIDIQPDFNNGGVCYVLMQVEEDVWASEKNRDLLKVDAVNKTITVLKHYTRSASSLAWMNDYGDVAVFGCDFYNDGTSIAFIDMINSNKSYTFDIPVKCESLDITHFHYASFCYDNMFGVLLGQYIGYSSHKTIFGFSFSNEPAFRLFNSIPGTPMYYTLPVSGTICLGLDEKERYSIKEINCSQNRMRVETTDSRIYLINKESWAAFICSFKNLVLQNLDALNVSKSILPEEDDKYSLGNATFRLKSVTSTRINTESMYLGDMIIDNGASVKRGFVYITSDGTLKVKLTD